MQKIMMPAKPWCDHTEGFESGLRAWELDVGEWERASGTALTDAGKYTVMMNMAPVFFRSTLHLGTYSNSAALRTALLQWRYSSRNFGANPTASYGNGTSADDDRMQIDSPKKGERKGKGRNQHQRGNRTTNTSSTDTNTSKNCGKPGHWAKDCWNPDGGAYVNSTYSNTGKGKSKHTGKGKGKHVDVVETEQPQPSETASTVSTLSRKARERAKVKTNIRESIARPTRALQTSTRASTVAELDIGKRAAGDQVEEHTTIPPVTTATRRKARVTRKAKGKANTWRLWKRISLLKQLQPCRIFNNRRVQLDNLCAIHTWTRGSWV